MRVPQEGAFGDAGVERLAQLAGAGKPQGRVLLQAPQDQCVDARMDAGPGGAAAGCDHLTRDVSPEDIEQRFAAEEDGPGDHLVKDGAQGVDVAALVGGPPLGLFG